MSDLEKPKEDEVPAVEDALDDIVAQAGDENPVEGEKPDEEEKTVEPWKSSFGDAPVEAEEEKKDADSPLTTAALKAILDDYTEPEKPAATPQLPVRDPYAPQLPVQQQQITLSPEFRQENPGLAEYLDARAVADREREQGMLLLAQKIGEVLDTTGKLPSTFNETLDARDARVQAEAKKAQAAAEAAERIGKMNAGIDSFGTEWDENVTEWLNSGQITREEAAEMNVRLGDVYWEISDASPPMPNHPRYDKQSRFVSEKMGDSLRLASKIVRFEKGLLTDDEWRVMGDAARRRKGQLSAPPGTPSSAGGSSGLSAPRRESKQGSDPFQDMLDEQAVNKK